MPSVMSRRVTGDDFDEAGVLVRKRTNVVREGFGLSKGELVKVKRLNSVEYSLEH